MRIGIRIISAHSGKILLPEYVILEVVTLIENKLNKKMAEDFLKMVKENEDIEIIFSSEEFCRLIMGLFPILNLKKLSFVDIALLALSREYKVITFDKNLEKAIQGI